MKTTTDSEFHSSTEVIETFLHRGLYGQIRCDQDESDKSFCVCFATTFDDLAFATRYSYEHLKVMSGLVPVVATLLELSESATISEEREANAEFERLGVLFHRPDLAGDGDSES